MRNAISTTTTTVIVKGDQKPPPLLSVFGVGAWKVGYGDELEGVDEAEEDEDDVGDSVAEAEVTVNAVLAQSELSDAVTEYVPADTDGTVNCVISTPKSVGCRDATVVPANWIVTMLSENPKPVTETVVPTGPELGLRDND